MDKMRAQDDKLNAREITSRGRCGKVQLRGMDPRKTFYLAMSVGNLDGSIEAIDGETVEAIVDTEAEAIAEAGKVNDSYPTLEVWVYRCVPVAKVWRGPMKVTKIVQK